MDFDVILPGTNRIPGAHGWAHALDADGFRRILAVVDRLGYRSVSVSEHLAMPHAEVPRLGPYWQDALTVMAFAAAATRRVRIDAAVLVLPYHHPLRLAKQLATIDVLSGGRLNISVGVGHAVAEFEALGVPFARRGAIADEILDALRALWGQERPRHRGERFAISGLAVEPTPLQRPRPPIFVGGNSKPALRRAARHDGWQPNPVRFTVGEIPPLLDYLRSQPEFEGKAATFDLNWLKSPTGARLPGGFAGAGPAVLAEHRDRLVEAYRGEYRSIGITRTVVEPPRSLASEGEYLDYLAWFTEEVVPAVPTGRPPSW
ncbi:TIGR03619 family F420-dependent LLM class oxidoreductase [Pseudonocardia humida]|uniref:TIGR03619 family F420-dependent LLM class oxidoreductase n=1 Tax=Pseudonocardia humida TaxID=2800819 RepID=A0ABT0ZY03_9PSEU|nr:TIGR03619 family F420-dependent LLM class oxidoreductase [Pseudonocardia humida]MCO1655550.1 TIGR03619 family F420-dependent LLM class oxidoreductase [Pseudonocardia humida]